MKRPCLYTLAHVAAVTGRKTAGSVLLPSSQLLRLWGRKTMIPGRPVDIAIDSTHRKIAVLNEEHIDIFDSKTDAVLGTVKTRTTSYPVSIPSRRPRTMGWRNTAQHRRSTRRVPKR
jgi:hypothetical protein